MIEHLDGIEGMLECQKHDQHDWREIAWHKDQINNNGVDEDEGSLIHAASKGFTHTYWESSNASCLIVIMFINMLANVDAGNAQPIRNTSKNNIPNVANVATFDECHRQINASDHDGSPHQENCQMAESLIIERIGVRKKCDRAECNYSN